MEMKTYLSIDLDYWNGQRRRSIDAFFGHVFALRLPIWVAPFHHQLLPHINQCVCDTLINVDFHSDIAEWERKLSLTEGTWANFVTWRRRGTFIWRHSCWDRWGGESRYCHWQKNPFKEDVSGWKCVLKQEGLRSIPWHTVQAVGVSLSSYWLRKDNPCRPIIRTLGIEHRLNSDQVMQAIQARPHLIHLQKAG